MKIERIILDLDDVLNHLTLDALRFFGVDIESYEEYPVKCGFDIRYALSELTGKPKMDLSVFWDAVPREVWKNSTPAPELHNILQWCYKRVGQNILIGTSPTKCPECMAGKYEWIENNLPPWLHRQYAITPRKWWFGRYDTLLIDDNEDNCAAMRREGGCAIALPRPWNRNWGKDVMLTIQTEFEELC